MKISFIIPSRDNLVYLKQAYESIRRHYKDHEIVMLDDASTDGTWEWLSSLSDDNIVIYRNEGPDRVGHTILYDKGVELSTTNTFTIFHADMVCSNRYVENLLKHLKSKTVVCATRIEPPLHPPGPEKIVRNFGLEPIEFKLGEFSSLVSELLIHNSDKTTDGIFAPWMMMKEDFQAIGGHDKLFAPMELEDSDIFNRMYLAGYKLIQSRDAFVYHMTCRGSRFKGELEIESEIPLPDGTIWYKPKDSKEYTELRQIKFREWWRKWHQNVLHDENMMPIVNSVYNIGMVVKNCHINLLHTLEPWCDSIYIEDNHIRDLYIKTAQPETQFDLSNRIKILPSDFTNDIVIEFDGRYFKQPQYDFVQKFGEIISDSGEEGELEYDIFKIYINKLTTYEHDLIRCNN